MKEITDVKVGNVWRMQYLTHTGKVKQKVIFLFAIFKYLYQGLHNMFHRYKNILFFSKRKVFGEGSKVLSLFDFAVVFQKQLFGD